MEKKLILIVVLAIFCFICANSNELLDDDLDFEKLEGLFPESRCKHHVEVGYCIKNIKRWAYVKGECYEFFYSGCGGNSNNFHSFDSCLQHCEKLKKKNHREPLKSEPIPSFGDPSEEDDDTYVQDPQKPNMIGFTHKINPLFLILSQSLNKGHTRTKIKRPLNYLFPNEEKPIYPTTQPILMMTNDDYYTKITINNAFPLLREVKSKDGKIRNKKRNRFPNFKLYKHIYEESIPEHSVHWLRIKRETHDVHQNRSGIITEKSGVPSWYSGENFQLSNPLPSPSMRMRFKRGPWIAKGVNTKDPIRYETTERIGIAFLFKTPH